MKKTPSEGLFRLIQSLNKGEKRNFKLLAGLLTTEKDKKYIELFDAIDKQGAYDEMKLARALRHLYGGQLSVGKNYLYKLILKSLVHFRYGNSSEVIIILEQVKILTEKELYVQANKLIKKGIALAIESEDFQSQYAFLCVQSDILMILQSERMLFQRLNENAKKRAAVLEQLNNWESFHALANQLLLIRKAHRLSGRETLVEEADRLRQHPLLQGGNTCLSKRAQIEFHTIQRILHSFDNNFEAAANSCQALITCCDSAPRVKESVIRTYYTALYNLCIYQLKQGKYEEGFRLLEKFKGYQLELNTFRADFFQAYHILLCAISLHLGQPEKVIAQLDEMEAEWKQLAGKIQRIHALRLRFWIAYTFFMDNQPRMALKWINELLSESRNDIQIDLLNNGKLLNIMIHLELGNFGLVESETSSVRRLLEKHGRYNEFEKQMVKCARALARAGDGPEYPKMLQVWYKKWQQNENDPKKGYWILNPEGWLHQKVTGESMRDFQKKRIQSPNFVIPF